MSTNTIKVLDAVSKEISRRFDMRADVINAVNRQYDKPHKAFGSNSGSSIQIKQPQRVRGTASATLEIQDVVEKTSVLPVATDYHVGMAFTASSLTQDLLNPKNMKMFADDYFDAAIDDIIGKVQTDLMTYIHQNTWNSVGVAGTGPTSYLVVTQARAKLNYGRAPRTNRSFILGPNDAALLNNAQSGLFHAGDAIGKNYKDGALASSNGFIFIESPDVTSHTSGARNTAYQINGAGQTGSQITVDTGANAVAKGDIFTIANHYSVDPVTGQSSGNLQQYTVTEATSGTTTTIKIAPEIITSGAYQTVVASPADDALITFLGTASTAYPRGVAMHRDAYVLGTCELGDIGVTYEVPIITGGAGDGYSQGYTGPQKGIQMKLYMDGDITNRRSVARLDIRYGIGPLVREWSTIVQGK